MIVNCRILSAFPFLCLSLALTPLKRISRSTKNYTSGGFRRVTAPPALQKLLTDFWETNKDKAVDEEWESGNIFTNHWEIPTKFVDVSDDQLVGGGESLMEAIWGVAKKEVEEWTGMKMRPSSLYGIRVYTEGSILNPHVDRLPLIGSCIVNVAQDGTFIGHMCWKLHYRYS